MVTARAEPGSTPARLLVPGARVHVQLSERASLRLRAVYAVVEDAAADLVTLVPWGCGRPVGVRLRDIERARIVGAVAWEAYRRICAEQRRAFHPRRRRHLGVFT